MSWKQALSTLTVLVPVTSQVNAAVVRASQDFLAEGDFGTGVYDDNYMPTFDTSLGSLIDVRVQVDGLLQWEEPLIAQTGAPGAGTYKTITSVFVFNNENLWEIDGPTEFHSFAGTIEDISQEVAIYGAFFDDPSLYMDAANLEDLVVEPSAAAFCASNCIEDVSDDAFGVYSGTLRTTFIYTPEPACLSHHRRCYS